MRVRATECGWKMAVALAVATILTIGGCPRPADTAHVAECGAIRQFYDDAQSKLIDSGACDKAASVSTCVPHIALREAFIASLEKEQCPSQAH